MWISFLKPAKGLNCGGDKFLKHNIRRKLFNYISIAYILFLTLIIVLVHFLNNHADHPLKCAQLRSLTLKYSKLQVLCMPVFKRIINFNFTFQCKIL